MPESPRELLRTLFRAAIDAADPKLCVPPHLPTPPTGRTVVVGGGKAAASMARAVEEKYLGTVSGAVVTRYGHAVPCQHIAVIEAAHPVPDAAGAAGAERLLDAVRGLTKNDLVLCLMSGGASALLTLPGPGITLEEMRALTTALLKSGAAIGDMNTVRKHLSRINGGRLAAAAHPARVLTLAISDVPGDDPATIGSGPTVPDATTLADARNVLQRFAIQPAPSIAAHLARAESESVKPGDPRLARAEFRLVASPQASLEAAAALARKHGLAPLILGDAIEGEAREVAKAHAQLALDIAHGKGPVKAPAVVLSGGETTVTVRGKGRGGRNAEFLLALTLALEGKAGIFSLAGDTDGIDGTEDNAGAIATPDSLARARQRGLDAAASLANNDGYGFFTNLGDLVVTGPTLTNVNDFRAILVLPA
jgi:hydroxypyruvate reductase